MEGFAAGDLVFNTNGWSEYALMGEGVARPSYMIPRKLDPAQGRISQAVGVLGMLGLTAYAGMILLAGPKAGETAVVSAASGGVGQIAGQLARSSGARVVGIAGREAKCRFVVDELGFDACVSHLSPTMAEELRAACPDGVDVYFENVGGAVQEAAFGLLNPHARVVMCGMVAQYNASEPPPGPNLGFVVGKRVRIEGLIVFDQPERFAEWRILAAPWLRDGSLQHRQTIVDGLENAPEALRQVLRGGNFGKMLVRVGKLPA